MGIFTHVNGWCGAAWYPPRGSNRTPSTKPHEIREPPTDPNGTKAATINNHLIIQTLYSSGKQRKRKSREIIPANIIYNFPFLQPSFINPQQRAIGNIKMHIITNIINSISSFFFCSGVIYSTPLTVTRS